MKELNKENLSLCLGYCNILLQTNNVDRFNYLPREARKSFHIYCIEILQRQESSMSYPYAAATNIVGGIINPKHNDDGLNIEQWRVKDKRERSVEYDVHFYGATTPKKKEKIVKRLVKNYDEEKDKGDNTVVTVW